jgi:tetratricopeptide (TPR) repeat protein
MAFFQVLRGGSVVLGLALMGGHAQAECTCTNDFQVDDDASAKQAVTECSAVLKSTPNKKALYTAALCRGLANVQLKHYGKAIADFDAAQAANPKVWNPTLEQAKLYEKTGLKQKAIAAYRNVLAINSFVVDASDALHRLGADKNDPNEAWRSGSMPTADGRKISYPPYWVFQQFSKTTYLANAPWKQEPQLSCVMVVQDPLKKEHMKQDAAHWAGVFDQAFLDSWCKTNTPGGKYKDMRLQKSQLVKADGVPALQCAWSYGSTDKDDKKPRYNYMMKWFMALDTVPLMTVCTAEAKTLEKLKAETPTFVETFVRLKDSIVH